MSIDAFHTVAAILPEPMLLLLAEGQLVAANPRACDLFGWGTQLPAGQPLAAWLEEQPGALARYLRLCARTRQLVPGSITLVTPTGEQRSLRAEGTLYVPASATSAALVLLRLLPHSPLVSRLGELNWQVASLHREVRQRRRLEEALREANEALDRANIELQGLARTDALTALANRRHFDEQLEHECRRAARDQRPLSLVMMDVDRFKAYNDHLGHPAGDRCLAQVAQILQETLRRAGDIAARYGGEEFVALLPSSNASGALACAESIQQAMAEAALPHPAYERNQVTLSMGVATLYPVGNPDEGARLVALADEALYRAKASGRATICQAPPATHIATNTPP